MAEKKKKSKNDFWIQVLLMIAFLAGLLIMLYPFYVESINNFIDKKPRNLMPKEMRKNLQSSEQKMNVLLKKLPKTRFAGRAT